MKHDKKELFSLVKGEAKNLKKELKEKEKERLDFSTLDSSSRWNCVYGQSTGDCNSRRAIKLIKTCCTRVYNAGDDDQDLISSSTLNGSPKYKKRTSEKGLGHITFYSPIEVMIHEKGQKRNSKRLIDYLQGKEEKLTLI